MERTVKVTLLAEVRGFVGKIGEARAKAQQLSSDLQQMAVDRKATFTDIGGYLSAWGLAVTGVTGIAIKRFMDFDQAMSYVEAVTRESAYAMDLLREAALKAGAETVFTAVEAANAIEELAKAGVGTSDILGGGLAASLDLAASSGIGVAQAAEIAAGALGMFRLQGSDLADVVDYLSAGANKSIGEVTDLAYGMRQAGPVAYQMGLSVKETVAALAAFAATGRIGQDAGTSFKRMLQLLTPQSAAAQRELDRLGIVAFDAQGEFIGLANFAEVLQQRLGHLTTEQRNMALSVIYGSDAVAAAAEIYNLGREGVEKWIRAVDDQGYAAENAALRLGNLKGDLEQLGGSLDTLFVTMAAVTDGPLRGLVQGLTDVTNMFSQTSDEMQQSIFVIGAVAGGIALLTGVVFLALPKWAAYREAVKLLSADLPKLGAAVTGVMRTLGWVGAGLVAFSAIQTWSTQVQASLRATDTELQNLVKTTASGANIIRTSFQNLDPMSWEVLMGVTPGGVRIVQDRFQSLEYEVDNFGDVMDRLSAYQDDRQWFEWNPDYDKRIQRLNELGESYSNLADTDLPAAQNGFRMISEDMRLTEEQTLALLDMMPSYKDTLIDLATTLGLDAANAQTLLNLAMGEGEEGADSQALALGDLGAAAEDTSGQIKEMSDSIKNFNESMFGMRDTTRDAEQSYDDLTQAIKEAREAGATNADMMDITQQVGRDVQGAMDDYAAATNAAAAAIYSQTGSVEELNGYLDAHRQQLFDVAMQLYGNEEAAWAYVDSLVATPTEITTQVELQGIQAARDKLDSLIRDYNNKSVTLRAVMEAADNLGGYSTGGTIRGPGSGTSDSIIARLSNGEEVIRASQAERWRPLLKAINSGRLDSMQLSSDLRAFRYATGGTVGTPAYARSSPGFSVPTPAVSHQESVHLTIPIVPEAGQPVADQLFRAADRMRLRMSMRKKG